MAGLYSYARPGYQTGGISMGTRAGVKGRYGRFRREFEDVLSEQSLKGREIQAGREAKAGGLGLLGEMGGTLLAKGLTKGMVGSLFGMTPMGLALSIGLPMAGRYLLSEGYRKHGGGRKAKSAITTTGGGTTGQLWRGEARDVRGAFGAQEKALKAGIGSESALAGGRALSRLLASEATSKLGEAIKGGGKAVAEGGGIGSKISAEGVPEQSWLDKIKGGGEPWWQKDAIEQVPIDQDLLDLESSAMAGVASRDAATIGAGPPGAFNVEGWDPTPLGDPDATVRTDDVFNLDSYPQLGPDIATQKTTLGAATTEDIGRDFLRSGMGFDPDAAPPWTEPTGPAGWSGGVDPMSGQQIIGDQLTLPGGGVTPPQPIIPESEIDQMIGTTTAPYEATRDQNMLIKKGLGGDIPDLNQYLMDQGVSPDALEAHKAGLYEQFGGQPGAPAAQFTGQDLMEMPGGRTGDYGEREGPFGVGAGWQQLDPNFKDPTSVFTGQGWTPGSVEGRSASGMFQPSFGSPNEYTPSQPQRGGLLDFLRGYSQRAAAKKRMFGGGWSPFGVR
jgi:hypothetical protein